MFDCLLNFMFTLITILLTLMMRCNFNSFYLMSKSWADIVATTQLNKTHDQA